MLDEPPARGVDAGEAGEEVEPSAARHADPPYRTVIETKGTLNAV